MTQSRSEQFKHWYRNRQFAALLDFAKANENALNFEETELAGLSALKTGDLENASQFFSALVKGRAHARDHFHYGLVLSGLERYLEAAGHFDLAQADARIKPAAILNKIECYHKAGQPEKAMTQIEQLESKLRDQPATVLIEARCLYRLGHFDQALAVLDKHFAQSDDANVNALKAALWLKQGQFFQATELYRRLAERNPENVENWYNLAAALSNSTDATQLSEAIETARRCLSLAPGHPKARYCIALAHRKKGEWQQAREWLEPLFSEYPDSVEFREQLAHTLSDMGQHNRALAVLAHPPEPKPAAELFRLRGIVFARQGDFVMAEHWLEKARKLDNRDQRTLAYLAIAQLALGKQDQLIEFTDTDRLLKTFTLSPGDPFPDSSAFNKQLAMDIKNHSRLRHEPVGLAARKGYLTSDLMADRTKAIGAFRDQLEEAIKQYIHQMPDDSTHPLYCHKQEALKHGYDLNIWATWTRGDGYIDKHIHEQSWISGAYYVTVPAITRENEKGTKAGYFEFGCLPDDISFNRPVPRGYVRPRVGELNIFPSYLYHQTIPHGTEEDRISIAFDLTPRNWLVKGQS